MNNVTHVHGNETSSSSSSLVDMPIHTAAEQWVVALIMVCCLIFLLGLVMVLFSSGVRSKLRTLGYMIQTAFLRICCIPCRCCYKMGEKRARWIERTAHRLKTRVLQEEDDGSWSDSDEDTQPSLAPYSDL